MSDTVVDDSSNAFLLDGDLPRLGAAQPMLPNAQAPLVESAVESVDESAPTRPVVSPVPTDATVPVVPSLPTLPSQSIAEIAAVVAEAEAGKVEDRRHPMAHLMPEKLKPSEASLRAAEARAVKKRKAKRIKIAVTVGVLAVSAVVGPPLGRWLVDAVNEAGSTKSDEPTPTVAPGDEPAATPQAGLQAIEDLEQLTGDSTAPAATTP